MQFLSVECVVCLQSIQSIQPCCAFSHHVDCILSLVASASISESGGPLAVTLDFVTNGMRVNGDFMVQLNTQDGSAGQY